MIVADDISTPAPRACQLLDGLFLAVRTDKLKIHGVRFDPRFRFHLYDLDFCRSALEAQLRLGTWPIAVTHDSGGAYDSSAFKEAARMYLDKWRDRRPATSDAPSASAVAQAG